MSCAGDLQRFHAFRPDAPADQGCKVALITEDCEYRPQAGIEAATKLFDVNKADAAIGLGGSSVTLPIAELAAPKGKIILTTAASSAKLGNFPGTIFSALPLDDVVGTQVGDMRRAWCQPLRAPNLIANLVYDANGSDVTHVFVDGELLVEEGRLTRLDETELFAEAQAVAESVWAKSQHLFAAEGMQ